MLLPFYLNGDALVLFRYALIDIVGRGAYGVVCAARDELGGNGNESLVAIKKINNAFEHAVYTKRTLREIRLLRLLKHENIILSLIHI